MRIEEEIKQSSFQNEYQKLMVNIIYTGMWIRSFHAKNLKAFGLTPEQFNLLRILRGQHPKPASVNLLIDRMLDKSSNASRIVTKLVAKNLVTSKTCPNDKRQLDVMISGKGLGLLEQIDAQVLGYRNLENIISEEEAAHTNEILDKIRDM